MELGLIIVLALVGIYTTVLVVGAILEAKTQGRTEGMVIEGDQTAA